MSKDTNSSGIRGLRASQWTLRHLLLIVLIFGLGDWMVGGPSQTFLADSQDQL